MGEMLAMLGQGFLTCIMPANLIYLVGGVALGLVMGAIPGLTATMAIALLVPLTLYLSPTQAIIMLLGAFNGGTFGGSISAILLATPGTSAASATVSDGYALAKQGKAGKAIKTALVSSVFGCLTACVLLVLIAEPVAQYALKFGAPEYTILMLFALTIIASASGESMIKGLMAGTLGLLLGSIGMDPVETIPRLTFGSLNLSSGIDVVTMLIGSLALAEIFSQIETFHKRETSVLLPPPSCPDDNKFTGKDFKRTWKTMLRSALLGSGIGALPGLGATLAAWVGYDTAKRTSKHPEEFGKGSIEGIAGAEAANNAVCGSNMIPLLTLGIPGDVVAALIIGAFMLQGLTPGPLIFREAAQDVYNIYAGVIMSNVVMAIITLLTLRIFTKISKLQPNVVLPCVCMFCIVGVYALNSSLFDVGVMLGFAVLGYFLSKFHFPPACMLIGFILSPMLEKYFRTAMQMSRGSFSIFFKNPLDWVLWALTFGSLFLIIRGKVKGSKAKKQAESAKTE